MYAGASSPHAGGALPELDPTQDDLFPLFSTKLATLQTSLGNMLVHVGKLNMMTGDCITYLGRHNMTVALQDQGCDQADINRRNGHSEKTAQNHYNGVPLNTMAAAAGMLPDKPFVSGHRSGPRACGASGGAAGAPHSFWFNVHHPSHARATTDARHGGGGARAGTRACSKRPPRWSTRSGRSTARARRASSPPRRRR